VSQVPPSPTPQSPSLETSQTPPSQASPSPVPQSPSSEASQVSSVSSASQSSSNISPVLAQVTASYLKTKPQSQSRKMTSGTSKAISKTSIKTTSGTSGVTSKTSRKSTSGTSGVTSKTSKKSSGTSGVTSKTSKKSSETSGVTSKASIKVTSGISGVTSKTSRNMTLETSGVTSKTSRKLTSGTSEEPAEIVVWKKRKFDISSDEEESYDYINDAGSMKVTKQQTLNSTQLLLFKKGKKLREILLNSQANDKIFTNFEQSKLEMMNVMTELSSNPIKVIDTKTAEDRIIQWKEQESQCNKFRMTAELYNLLHLMSLVQVYEDVIRIGEELKKNPVNGIKDVGIWVMGFMRNKLNINNKAEQRSRVGCHRLRKLFNEGITCEQLAQSGLRKCDFFTKKENYEIFLSQIPSLNTRHSLSSNSSIERFSDILQPQSYDEIFSDSLLAESSSQQKKNEVLFKLDLRENFKDIADKYDNDEYIIT
jgi:hypothetical protein